MQQNCLNHPHFPLIQARSSGIWIGPTSSYFPEFKLSVRASSSKYASRRAPSDTIYFPIMAILKEIYSKFVQNTRTLRTHTEHYLAMTLELWNSVGYNISERKLTNLCNARDGITTLKQTAGAKSAPSLQENIRSKWMSEE